MATQDATYLNQVGFAPEIAPYGQNLLGMSAANIYDYQIQYELDADGKPKLDEAGNPVPKVDANNNPIPVLDASGKPIITGLKELPKYVDATGKPIDRQAQFTDLQKDAFAAADTLGQNTSSKAAATGLESLATKMKDFSYSPTTTTNQFTAPGTLGYTAKDATSKDYTTKDATAGKVTKPTDVAVTKTDAATTQAAKAQGIAALTANQMGPAGQVAGNAVTADQINAAQMGPADKVATKSFAQPGSADAYMSPYIQAVVEKQQREAQRTADIAATRRGAQAAGAGAFGGSRQAIENAEAARNLQTQMGDIQAQGLQDAYKQAQAQFNAEQNAGLTAQTANQQAGLTVGTQNLTAAQQAAVQNAANALQAKGMTADQAMKAALANQQADLTVGQQNLAAKQATQQLQTNADVQVQLANLNAEQQANVQNAAQQFQASGMNADQAMKAALANQSTGLTTGIQNAQMEQQANLANANATNAASQFGAAAGNTAALANANATNAAAQFGAGQGLTAAQTAAQYGQAAAQLGEQSKQFGSSQGLAALQAAGQTNAALGAQGQNLYNQDVNNIGIQNTLGTQQQQNVQNLLSQNYSDFQNEANLPYKQLGFMSDIVRGAPTSVQGTSVTTAAPSFLNQVAGAGTALFGLSQPTAKARGGAIKQRKITGLPAILINSMARG
jgi:hypothetical protein